MDLIEEARDWESKRWSGPRSAEVLIVENELVRQMRLPTQVIGDSKRIAQFVEITRNTVTRYFRGGAEAKREVRPNRRNLSAVEQARGVEL